MRNGCGHGVGRWGGDVGELWEGGVEEGAVGVGGKLRVLAASVSWQGRAAGAGLTIFGDELLFCHFAWRWFCDIQNNRALLCT